MQVLNKEQLIINGTYYKVYGLGSKSFIDTFIVKSAPVLNASIESYFINVDSVYNNGERKYNTDISLTDAGITDKPHNSHKTFTTLEEANIYMKYCIDNNVGTIYNDTFLECWHDFYSYDDFENNEGY